MPNLFTGSEAVPLKDAIHRVNQNIRDLEEKLQSITPKSYAAKQIQSFYESRLEIQTIILSWLQSKN